MRHQTRAIVLFSVVALVARLRQPWPEPKSIEGLAQMLGRACDGTVQPTDIAWEPSRGVLAEILSGRQVLFLARHGREPRDLWRARVRLTIEGQPIAVRSVRNLTSTPLGDEQSLVAFGEHAAFATSSYNKVGQITLLDLHGQPRASGGSPTDLLMGAVTNLQETGSSEGLGRVDVVLDDAEPHIGLAFLPNARLSIRAPGGRSIELDTDAGKLIGDASQLRAQASTAPTLLKRPVLWAVDTLRAEVGPEPITWLEEKAFSVRDAIRRVGYAWNDIWDPAAIALRPVIPSVHMLGGEGVQSDPSIWPPPPIPSIWARAEAGEGTWEAVQFPWLKRLPAVVEPRLGNVEPPAYFYKTAFRADPERPYVKVLVVAMDTRQLELDMEGGVEDPKPLTGVHGAGKIPRDPEILERVVGAFNGAFKTTHGEYGMMVDGKVLLPPKPNAATVVVTQDRRIGLGTWGASTTIPADLLSYRQNLEPLVEDGRLMPSGRTQWGFQLAGTSLFTVRSGLCMTTAGHLYYLWGDELSGATLAKAMLQAGCSYGMHLDMNPHHTAFVFASVRSPASRDYEAKLLTPAMEVLAERYLEWSPKDFFYVMLRDPSPPGNLAWVADGGVQPAPAWLSAVSRARWSAPRSPTSVELVAFDSTRVGWRLGRHDAPPSAEARAPHHAGADAGPSAEQLSSEDASRVLAAIGVGAGTHDRRGECNPAKHLAALHVGESSQLEIRLDVDGCHEGTLRFPLILSDGKPTEVAHHHTGAHRRSGLCIAASGHVIAASALADSDSVVAEALAHVGCASAVGLHQAASPAWVLDRAGTTSPPLSKYPQPILYALGQPMHPRTFRYPQSTH